MFELVFHFVLLFVDTFKCRVIADISIDRGIGEIFRFDTCTQIRSKFDHATLVLYSKNFAVSIEMPEKVGTFQVSYLWGSNKVILRGKEYDVKFTELKYG